VAAVLAAAVSMVLVGLPAPSFASSTVATGLSTGLSTGGTAARPATPAPDATSDAGSATAGPGTPSGSDALHVYVDAYDGIASPTTPLAINGHLSSPVAGLSMRVAVIQGGVHNRDDLARLRADPTLGGRATYSWIAPPVPVNGTGFSINQTLTITKPLTVYAVKIAAVAPSSGKILGAAYTFLVWSPTQESVQPVSLTTVLPIADYPRLRSDGMLTDNDLVGELGADGRLTRLLRAVGAVGGQPSSIALAVDPTLLAALQKMSAAPYWYADPGGRKQAPRSAAAAEYLAALRAFAAMPGNTVFALPWGDADLAALVRAAGVHDAGQIADAAWAVQKGKDTLRDVLGVASPVPIAYPGDGLADASTLDFLTGPSVGATTAILDDRLLPAASKTLPPTPTALTVRQTANGSVRALAADSRLATLLSPKISATGQSEGQALASVLAEVGMITAERPGAALSRLLVLALPRRWDPPTDDWASLVLRGLATQTGAGYQPFVQPVSLPAAPAQGTRTTGGTATDGAASENSATGGTVTLAPAGTARGYAYPDSAVATEIPTSYVDAVEHLRDEVKELDPVLCAVATSDTATSNPPSPAPCALTQATYGTATTLDGRRRVVRPMEDTLLTALSVDWRPDRSGAVRLSQEVDGRINEIRGSVKIVASSKVTLTSRHGTVPLTLQNVSSQPESDRFPMTVILSLFSSDRTRLQSAARQVLTLRPDVVTQVEIRVSSDAAGTFPVYVQVLTPDGKRLSTQQVRILVRSTAYGSIATAITYLTVGLFAVTVILRQIRRARRRRRGGGPGDDPTTKGPGASTSTDDATTPLRRIQANAAGTQRTDVPRAYAGGVPANPSEP
jgi:hypothetical protein